MTEIKFGTDGWRAVSGQDFTPENVARVIQAFCDLYRQASNHLVYVGYDRRLDSEQTARLVAQILAANGFDVRLSVPFCPTPCISWLVKQNGALCGVIVTASHNPPQWNGIKFKESSGSAASSEYTRQIEERIAKNDQDSRQTVKRPFEDLQAEGKIAFFSPHETYVRHLQEFIDTKAISQAGFHIVFDPLFGAGTDFVASVLPDSRVTQIHGETDPHFGGLNPEPIEKNLSLLKKTILELHADIGLATDGDADRIGAFDEQGCFVNSHQIFALLLLHHIRYRKLSGAVIKSFSTTRLIDAICKKYGLPLVTTPIGFKHISRELLMRNALMGGEESGGISLREHVHERDGILNGLLLVEMMAVNGKSLSGLIREMDEEFGHFYFARDDYHIPQEKIGQIKASLAQQPFTELDGIAVTGSDTLDGTKFIFADDSWLLIRASGTEPLMRVYAEALSAQRVKNLLAFFRQSFQL